MTAVTEQLAIQLAHGQVIPFIGAGVSMSLGLPSYASLIRKLGEHVGFDGDIFEQLGDYLTLAEFYDQRKGGLHELRDYLQENWKKTQKEIVASPVYRAIVELECKLIYTTNFDDFLERAHRGLNRRYRAIRNVNDFVNLSDDKVHIVKLHGDLRNSKTMVLTESHYFERMTFESPLDIKLRADILGKSVLFIGYSLSDINVRLLLFRLKKLWDSGPRPEFRPKSYVFMDRPNEVLAEVLRSRGVEPIIAESTDQSASLVSFLTSLRDRAAMLPG
ncbi:Sir2 family NAD-dependent protein deacetylase [Chlorobium phaeovibrioides]|uniref:SIR2 family protein n=1 Tax=Chlorobium phaeovibrioides TaxID=1094 RepID=UPI000F83F8BF|nr:SIR2 family protein [Chlorobium phaeovibrioides]RTY33720.1 Sir2 family NAD-dependent protein deacetylase [Chlorobium phaeovibrioides]